MSLPESIESYKEIYLNQLRHLKFKKIDEEYVAILIDSKGHEIIKGFGNSTIEAINDLHSALL